jgi:DNA repair photolyase
MAIDFEEYTKGRGAQKNADNPFSKTSYVSEHPEGLDEPFWEGSVTTSFIPSTVKTIVNKVESPDLGFALSMNPYQGCEHGCIYCYARNSHQYWGFSAGLDFESKIIVKKNAPALLAKTFDQPRWQPYPILLSGNTDCYQPAERKFQITRQMLEVCLRYRHPVHIITKNSLVLRDSDILKEMAALNLVHVSVTLNSLSESTRLRVEPRTASVKQRLKTIEHLAGQQIPVHIMVAPIIPGLTDHEIPEILKTATALGALDAHYTLVRLNGSIGEVFSDWVRKAFPERAEKILNQIADCHEGKLNDSRYGKRMKGDGQTAQAIAQLFRISKNKHMAGLSLPSLDTTLFKRPGHGQLTLF